MIHIIDTAIGHLVLTSSENSLVSIGFTNEPVSRLQDLPKVMELAVVQLQEYFTGTRQEFSLPLAVEGTDFQTKVWAALQTIPFGQTISYLQLARLLNDPKCIRAAAHANGQNPFAVVIPCHRVIGSDGGLVGYAGGLEMKKWLLKHENAEVMNQMNLF